MLKYDYIIERNEGDEVRKYIPDLIPKELSNVVYIEGPNSCGKSTLLSLIALAFFGLKFKDSLHPALRDRLQHLFDSDHQKIKFDIELENERTGEVLKSIKNNPSSKDITVKIREGNTEKTIIADQFSREFKLIYDIPDNPLERLPQLLVEIKNSQALRGNKITRLKNIIREQITGIKNSRDPKLLEQHYAELDKKKKEYEEYKGNLAEQENFLNDFEKFIFSKLYLQYAELHEEVVNKIIEMQKSHRKVKRDVNKCAKEQSALLSSIRENIEESDSLHVAITTYLKSLLPKSEKYHLDLWKNSNCSVEVHDPEVYETIRKEADYFIDYLPKLQDEHDKIREANFFTSLIQLLSDYSDSAITIPVANKNISEFIVVLQKELKKFETIRTKDENIQKTISLLENLKKYMKEAIRCKNEYKALQEQRGEKPDFEDFDMDEFERLQKRRDSIKEKTNSYFSELAKIEIDEKDVKKTFNSLKGNKALEMYDTYTEDQLRDKIQSLRAEVNDTKQNTKRYEKHIKMLLSEIERLEKKEPHKYQAYLSQLEMVLEVVLNLEKKFLHVFDDNINKIMQLKPNMNNLSESERRYAEFVGNYLAEKVRVVRHIKKEYVLKKVDVVKKELITESNKKIMFSDLGTGQGQAAFLSGLLSMDDNRKIIALFDEVAMLDSSTLQPIIDKLKDLYEQDKLLLGIIVQKADKMKVKSLT